MSDSASASASTPAETSMPNETSTASASASTSTANKPPSFTRPVAKRVKRTAAATSSNGVETTNTAAASPEAKGEKLPLKTIYAPQANIVMADSTEKPFVICSICNALPWDPFITKCEHVFCHTCLNEWLRKGVGHNTCPNCREPIFTGFADNGARTLAVANAFAYKLIGNCKIHCPMYYSEDKSDSCPWTGSYSDADEHVKNKCLWAVCECPYCQLKFCRHALPTHQQLCPMRPLDCTKCGKPGFKFGSAEFDEHRTTACPKRVVVCASQRAGCEWKGAADEVGIHMVSECEHTPITCSIPGCRAKLLRTEMKKHLETEGARHLSVLYDEFLRVQCHNAALVNVLTRVHTMNAPNGQPFLRYQSMNEYLEYRTKCGLMTTEKKSDNNSSIACHLCNAKDWPGALFGTVFGAPVYLQCIKCTTKNFKGPNRALSGNGFDQAIERTMSGVVQVRDLLEGRTKVNALVEAHAAGPYFFDSTLVLASAPTSASASASVSASASTSASIAPRDPNPHN